MSNSNLPPGCTNADIERAFGGGREPTLVEEQLIDLLQQHQIPQHIIDKCLEPLETLIDQYPDELIREPMEKEWDDDIPF
jgi:hypothetical protein